MLTQWLCITHDSVSPVHPPIWDPSGPSSGERVGAVCVFQWHHPICPCLQAVVSILSCLTINDHADKREEMFFQQALLSTSNSGKSTSVYYCLVYRLSLYIPLSIVCAPRSSHCQTPITHTLQQTKAQWDYLRHV